MNNNQYRIKNTLVKTVLYIICVLFLLMCIGPLYILFINATRTSQSIASSVALFPGTNIKANLQALLEYCEIHDLNIARSFFNSCIISFLSTLYILLIKK